MSIRGIVRVVAPVLCLAISALGADVPESFSRRCASCHASDGSGRKTPALGQVPDLRSKKISSLTDDQLYKAIAEGARHQAYAHSFLRLGLSESDIRQLVRYIRELQASQKSRM